MRRTVAVLWLVAAAGACGAGRPRVAPDPTPAPAIKTMLDCRAIADGGARLACFDQASATLAASIDKRDLVVMDQGQVRQARRSLFGFELPSLAIFNSGGRTGHDAASDQADREITATLRSARQDNEGNWVFGLDDGATWHQTDGVTIARTPKPGMAIVIRRAAFGSFLLKAGGQPAVKARRES